MWANVCKCATYQCACCFVCICAQSYEYMYTQVGMALIVSGQKLKQLRLAIISDGREVLILRGPCGSGKSTALLRICQQLEIPIHTYNSLYCGNFAEFVNRCSVVCKKSCVVFGKGALDIDAFVRDFGSSNIPNNVRIVFSTIEGSLTDHLSVQRIACATSIIPFHAFSESALTKLVDNVDVARNANGDARQAVLTTGDIKKRKRVAPKREASEHLIENSFHSPLGKDSEYSFFHIIGKVLYNKKNVCGLADLPAIADSGKACATQTLFENVVDFVPDVYVLERIFAGFACKDTLCSLDNGWLFSMIGIENKEPVKLGKFASFRKPRKVSTTKPPINVKYIHLLDWILCQTRGNCPGIDESSKLAIYNFLHTAEHQPSANNDTFKPSSDPTDDPIEDT